MKHLSIPLFTFGLHIALHAAPVELVVRGAEGSTAPIVVENMPADNLKLPSKWTFNATTSGWTPRTVLRVPADTNANFAAYLDADGSGSYTPGEPFGVSNLRDTPSIELTDTSCVCPRVNLWDGDVSSASDRASRLGVDQVRWPQTYGKEPNGNRFTEVTAPGKRCRVRAVRYMVDDRDVDQLGVEAGVVLEKDFEQTSRDFVHEGDFLADGSFDIDWGTLYSDVTSWRGVLRTTCVVSNMTYLIVYNWDKSAYEDRYDTNVQIKANATLVTRRFEKTRSIPTAVNATIRRSGDSAYLSFSFRIDNEDRWASWFGTTYTAFKANVYVASATNVVWSSDISRLPVRDQNGVYTADFANVSTLQNLSNLSWRVAVYNAKFSTDDMMMIKDNQIITGDTFSTLKAIQQQ